MELAPDPDVANKLSATTFWHRFLRSRKGRVIGGGAGSTGEHEPLFDSEASIEIDKAQNVRQNFLPADLRQDISFVGEDVYSKQKKGMLHPIHNSVTVILN